MHLENRMARRRGRIAAAITVTLLVLSAPSIGNEAGTSISGAKSYWLLVTFAGNGKPEELGVIAQSRYDGVAVMIGSAYDTTPTPEMADIAARFTQLHDASGKDIWPWVFVNRMLGTNPSENPGSQVPYFQSIRTMDFDPRGVAHAQFLADWTVALTVARKVKAPGVVLDLEFYNNYKVAYAISRFADQAGMSPREAADRLQSLGRELAGVVETVYPTAKIWISTSALNNPADQRIGRDGYFQPRGHIAFGMLQEFARSRSGAELIDGGEDSLGYCHSTLADLKQNIAKRQGQLAPLLVRYSTQLKLAGTITFWADSASKRGWLSEAECASSTVGAAEEFIPYVRELNSAYSYNWVYAAPLGGYRPFDAQVAGRFHAVLEAGARSNR